MLLGLDLADVGPARRLDIRFARRLNLITGDNGLGKSFLLDVGFYALTRSWAGTAAVPKRANGIALPDAKIGFEVQGNTTVGRQSARYSWSTEQWTPGRGRPAATALTIYARVDGGYAVWDPLRNRSGAEDDEGEPAPVAYRFDRDQVWDGLPGDRGAQLCNGLVADWVKWQIGGTDEFDHLRQVLRVLSPGPDEPLAPAKPVRVSVNDARDYPALLTPYGVVPVLIASAAIRRVLALAYLLVWTWSEHRRASELIGEPTVNRVVLLIDEVEAHLHPLWQRRLLPAVMAAVRALAPEAQVQVIATTHAPLILVSAEPGWDDQRDALFTIDLEAQHDGGAEPVVRRQEFAPRGNPSYWLESEAFDATPPRSVEAEEVLRELRAEVKNGLDRESALALFNRLSELTAPGDDVLLRVAASLRRRGIEVLTP